MSGYTAVALGGRWARAAAVRARQPAPCVRSSRPGPSCLSSGAQHHLPAHYSSSQSQSRRHFANTTAGTFAPSRPSRAAAAQQSECSSKLASVFDDSPNERLPPLPVPNLNDTLRRLRESIWPMAMNSAEFAHALELIEQFAEGPGPKLDLLLRTKAGQTRNWMTHDWWQQEAYLKWRAPLVINSNPAMIMPQLPYEVDDQRLLVQTSAQLISGLIEFKLALQSGYNPEASSEASEFRLNEDLCYAQYKHIYGTTRVPDQQVDKYVYASDCDEEQRFNLVLSSRGQFYQISLAPEANEHEQVRVDTLVSLLNKVFDQNEPQESAANGVGVLTTSARDQWARVRPLLSEHALQALESAQFLVCLDTVGSDDDAPFTRQLLESPRGTRAHLEALARQVLHADRANVGNRWFDKSLQLVIVSDRAKQRLLGAGINYEHSLAEGVVVTKLIEFVHDKVLASHNRAQQPPSIAGQGTSVAGQLRPLQMMHNLEPIETHLKRAISDYAAHVHQFDLSWFAYNSYGSNAIKSWRFSPDSWFQLALQLAHYQLHRRLAPAYESASTRRFAFGRTETIRSLTKDVAEFCFNPTHSTLQAAVESHKQYANAANNANAIDRVLMGYKLVFDELRSGTWAWGVPTSSEPFAADHSNSASGHIEDQSVKLDNLFSGKELDVMTAFFHNALLERTKKFALSTSQVSSEHPNICMSYGPYLADGYGCCYNITGQQIVANITANSENQSFSCHVHKFSETLHESLNRMRVLVEEQQRQRHI